MPLTTPPAASAPLYARNKLTGETYFVGSGVNLIDDLGDVDTVTGPPLDGMVLQWSAAATGPTGATGAAAGLWVPGIASTVGSIDDLNDVDTSTTPPTDEQALVWNDAAQQWVPSDVGIQYWDPIVNYVANDMVLWPETPPGTLWKAFVDNVGIEPVPSGTDAPTGLLFPGPTGAMSMIQTTPLSGFDITTGYDIRIETNGSVGDSSIMSTPNPSGGPSFIVGSDGTDVSVTNYPALPFSARRAIADFPSLNFIRMVVAATTVDFYSSADGSTWTPVGVQDVVPGGLLTQNANSIIIGNSQANTPQFNYNGVLRSVKIYDVTGTTVMSSWDRGTQPDALGAGISPETGENWAATGDLLDDPPLGTPGPWQAYIASGTVGAIDDLSDVDTTTVPPAPGDGLIWDGTNWVPGPGGSEVEVADVEPTANVAWELWADLSDTSVTDPMVLGLGMNDLTDADTASTPPIPGNVLAWSGTQWMPGIASSVDALDDLFDVDTSTVAPVDGDTLVYNEASLTWVPGVGGGRAYRETVPVAAFPATLTIAHGLNVATVSTTVVDSATRAVVTAEVTLTDANTATVTLATGTVGDYEVLVLG